MRQNQSYFSAGQQARFGQRPKDLVGCMTISLATLVAAAVHRWAGYVNPHRNPHRNPLRQTEKLVSYAFPASTEHFTLADCRRRAGIGVGCCLVDRGQAFADLGEVTGSVEAVA